MTIMRVHSVMCCRRVVSVTCAIECPDWNCIAPHNVHGAGTISVHPGTLNHARRTVPWRIVARFARPHIRVVAASGRRNLSGPGHGKSPWGRFPPRPARLRAVDHLSAVGGGGRGNAGLGLGRDHPRRRPFAPCRLPPDGADVLLEPARLRRDSPPDRAGSEVALRVALPLPAATPAATHFAQLHPLALINKSS